MLGEPGTVGGALRGLGELPEPQRRHVAAALPRLRLHDLLVWLTGTLPLHTAVALGEATEEWRRSLDATR